MQQDAGSDAIGRTGSTTAEKTGSVENGDSASNKRSGVDTGYREGISNSSSAKSGSSSDAPIIHTAGKGLSKAGYVKTGKGSVRYDLCMIGYKAKSAKVPDTVKIGKKIYKVTAVASGAFYGYDRLKTVTVGSQVKRIGGSAFSGCGKLKTLVINSKKLTKAGVKGSLKGSAVNKILCPQKVMKRYKKAFTKKNAKSVGRVAVKRKK